MMTSVTYRRPCVRQICCEVLCCLNRQCRLRGECPGSLVEHQWELQRAGQATRGRLAKSINISRHARGRLMTVHCVCGRYSCGHMCVFPIVVQPFYHNSIMSITGPLQLFSGRSHRAFHHIGHLVAGVVSWYGQIQDVWPSSSRVGPPCEMFTPFVVQTPSSGKFSFFVDFLLANVSSFERCGPQKGPSCSPIAFCSSFVTFSALKAFTFS